MFKKLLSAIFEDIQWMLLALAAATVIWFIGMNMSDPYQNQSVMSRLRLDNFEIMTREGLVVLNEDALREIDVAVTVRARRSDMDRLRSAMTDTGIVEVSVDFRAVDSDATADGVSIQQLRISPNLQAGFEHLSISPAYADVHLDKFSQQIHSIQAIQHGDVPPGFELQHILLGNDRVTISGPRTDLGRVSLVQAYVDITGIHDDAELPVELTVLDTSGNDMTERVHLSVTETTANVRVWKVRQVDVIVRGVGQLASGFAMAGYDDERMSVEIVGPEDILNSIEHIRAEIDLTGANENTTHKVLLEEWLPEGVYLRKDEINEFYVTAKIEPIELRTFTVPHGNVRSRGVVGLYQLVDNNASIRVTVSGPRSIIAAFDGNQIVPEFDLRGRAIGIHTVPLVIELPAELSIVGQAPSLLVQIHEPAAADTSNGDEDDEPEEPPVQPPPEHDENNNDDEPDENENLQGTEEEEENAETDEE